MGRFLMVILFILSFFVSGPFTYADNERITLYISGPQKMIATLEDKFEEIYGDVIDLFYTGCGPLKQKVWMEMLAGSIQADVIWGAEPILYHSLRERGVLQQYISPLTKNMREEYIYGDGYYTAVNARYGVIVYNEDYVRSDDIPRSWLDLTKRNWHNRLVMADATQSAMAFALVVGLYNISGNNWELLEAYNTNHLSLTKTNEEAISKVQSGEVWAGIVPHDGILRLIKQAQKKGVQSSLKIVWPTEGAISVQRPIAIIKKTRSLKAEHLVKSFVDFSLSEPAQRIAGRYGFITVCQGLTLPEGVPSAVKYNTLDWEFASIHEDELLDKFTRIVDSLLRQK